jgi:septum formation protein
LQLHRPIVLASQSPRRKEILTRLGLPFRVQPAHIDETQRSGEQPWDYVVRLAEEKARAIAIQQVEGAAVLGADTTVAIDDLALEKPLHAEDNARMLRLLSGREHTVYTGVALVLVPELEVHVLKVATCVRFRALSERTIAAYAASREGADKAGGYGIQDLGAALVAEIRGSYTNVVGLPASDTVALLEASGVLGEWP